MAEAGTDPLWMRSGEVYEPVHPFGFGLSWRLARDLVQWAAQYDSSVDWDDPGGARLWDEGEAAAHDAAGEVLARRLARELASTGRGDLPVAYWSECREALLSVQG